MVEGSREGFYHGNDTMRIYLSNIGTLGYKNVLGDFTNYVDDDENNYGIP